MMKRKEFMLGATFGLVLAAGATAGGVIDWPTANAGPVAGKSGRLTADAGAAGLFAPPQGAPLSFADIFQQVAPAVVQIDVEAPLERPPGGVLRIPGIPFGVPVPEPEEGEEAPTTVGAGSGFFISADGYIVTNSHVVANATKITVRLADQRELEARLIGRDEATDLAVIKVEGGDYPFVAFEEQAQPRVGDWVIAVGNPFGLGGTATAGIVSAQARGGIDADTPYTDYLQIDAAINRGNSGGPTFDIYGRVIGVNSAIYSPTGNSVGIGFAIPASIAKPITDRLMRGETIERGYIGVTIGNADDETLGALGLPANTQGALVNTVEPGGPAAAAGLQFGDVIVAMNGRPVADSNDLTRRVGALQPGQTARLEYIRDGNRRTANLRLAVRPSTSERNNGQGGAPGSSGQPEAPTSPSAMVIGLNVTPLTEAMREQIGAPARVDGVLVTGIGRGGDRRFQSGGVVIQRVGSVPVETVADLRAAVEAARRAGRDSVLLMVWTPGAGSVPVVVDLPDPE